jgi:hypothetical protein
MRRQFGNNSGLARVYSCEEARDMDTTTHPFTDSELERLSVYRTAVAAGFYSDWGETIAPAEAPTVDERPSVDYPFSPAELARLTARRAAVRAGYYSEQD